MCGSTRHSTPHDDDRVIIADDTPTPSWIPRDQASQSSYHFARVHLHQDIFNHSLRVYRYAVALRAHDLDSVPHFQPTAGQAVFTLHDPFSTRDAPPDQALLFAAAIFHDIGTSVKYNGEQRFEVCGADAALETLGTFEQFTATELREIWTAIALHTSPGIAERMSPLTRLLRIAVKADFGAQQWKQLLGEEFIRETETILPRRKIEKNLGDVVVAQAKMRVGDARTLKAPKVSWPWHLLRARLDDPSWEGVNPGF